MKRFIKNSMLLFFSAILFSSCAGEDLDDKDGELLNNKMLVYIDSQDLIGTWKLTVMESNTPVDLDEDGVTNTNLLKETWCFNDMNIDLRADGNFSSKNARMDFQAGETNDKFLCMTPRTDVGTWSVEGDELILAVNIEGTVYIRRKEITMKDNTFSFNVTKLESEQYVKDPGNTVVSGITVMYLTYTKV
ncbi:MAG TPA: lipocalin family protein [Gillisia sp.]|nr:lipocalin family protein [Gillisia sp.]